jgi:hypothetical protein
MAMFDLERLLDAIRWQESRGNPNAVSPKGARGPYQIMDFNTAEAIGGSGKIPIGGATPIPRGMLEDEDASRQFAREAITGLLKEYGGDTKRALAAYNAGPGTINSGRMPAETAAYVPAVLNRYDHDVAASENVPGSVQPSERQRFDAVVASRLGSPEDLTKGLDTSFVNTGSEPIEDTSLGGMFLQGRKTDGLERTPMSTGGMSPIEDPGMSGMFLSGREGIQPPTAMGMGSDGGVEQADAAEEAEAAGHAPYAEADAGGGSWVNKIFPGDEETSKMGLFERLRQPGNRQAMFRFGGGLAGNAHKGWGAGIGAGFEGAADALDRQEALDVTRRRTELAEMGPRAAFGALYQHYKSKNDPDALNKAMIGAYAPESGKFMGMTDERTEAQKNAEYFGPMDPKDPAYQFAPTKAARMTVAEKNEIFKAENELPNVKATEDMLREAAKLNPDTMTGYTAGIRADLGSKLPGGMVPDSMEKSAKATNEWQKLMGMEAIKTMANTLKGATTDFELNEFVKLLADPSTPIETRGRIIERMQQLAIVKRKMIRERVNELRGGTFFRPGGGSSDEPMEDDEDPLGVGM